MAAPFYVLSHSFVKYLVEHAGLPAVLELTRAEDVDAALAGATRRGLREWKADWLRSLGEAGGGSAARCGRRNSVRISLRVKALAHHFVMLSECEASLLSCRVRRRLPRRNLQSVRMVQEHSDPSHLLRMTMKRPEQTDTTVEPVRG